MKVWQNIVLPGLFFLALIGNTTPAYSENWLPPGSSTEFTGPAPLEILSKAPDEQALLGKLLFNSPAMLGEKAVRIGLSCNSCHPAGHVNTSFYISGLSEQPGTIDVSNGFWHAGAEDGKFNPVVIPTLRGVNKSAPFGTTISLPTLHAFTRHVIVREFGGPEPEKWQSDALVAYMNLLETETYPDMSIQVEAIPIGKLIALLKAPLAAQDELRLEKIASLIREELGRQLTPQNQNEFQQVALRIKAISRQLSSAPSTAQALFDKLVIDTAAQ